MKRWVVIMTDFGPDNIGNAAMKGVIANIDSELMVTDMTGNIEPFNVWQASESLLYTEPFWPEGTVFVSVVDPGVGTARRASVAKLKDGKYVVTPDNGTLTHLAAAVGIEAIRQIDETTNRLKGTEKTSVFHGRDLFAYTAGRLASGVIDFESVGPEYSVEEVVLCEKPLRAEIDGDTIIGSTTTLAKNFGNVFTNIHVEDLEAAGYTPGRSYHLTISSGERVAFDQDIPYVTSFGYVGQGEALMFNGSTLYMCIAMNQASFCKTYGIDSKTDWVVTLQKD